MKCNKKITLKWMSFLIWIGVKMNKFKHNPQVILKSLRNSYILKKTSNLSSMRKNKNKALSHKNQ